MNKDVSKNEQSGANGPKEQHNGSVGSNQNNRINVSVRYQEDIVSVEVNENASITALLVAAINATENQSVQKERFQLKLEGTVLDPKGKVNDYPINDGSNLVLVLVAGGGGNFKIITFN
jgi:hypothetical protein